jgi:hypothetical protein
MNKEKEDEFEKVYLSNLSKVTAKLERLRKNVSPSSCAGYSEYIFKHQCYSFPLPERFNSLPVADQLMYKLKEKEFIRYAANKENTKDAYDLALAMFCEFKDSSFEFIQWAIDKGATSWHLAMSGAGRSGSIETVKFIKQKATPHQYRLGAALYGSCHEGHLELSRLLIDFIMDSNEESVPWYGSFSTAVLLNRLTIAELMKEKGGEECKVGITKNNVLRLLDFGNDVQRVRLLQLTYVEEAIKTKANKCNLISECLTNVFCKDLLFLLNTFVCYESDLQYVLETDNDGIMLNDYSAGSQQYEL